MEGTRGQLEINREGEMVEGRVKRVTGSKAREEGYVTFSTSRVKENAEPTPYLPHRKAGGGGGSQVKRQMAVREGYGLVR